LARWRLLYELAVVATVLELGNRYTCSRFLNHEYVRALRIPKSSLESDDDQKAREALDRIGRTYVRRYGKEFKDVYGWAARVTKRDLDVSRPNFSHLEALAPEAA